MHCAVPRNISLNFCKLSVSRSHTANETRVPYLGWLASIWIGASVRVGELLPYTVLETALGNRCHGGGRKGKACVQKREGRQDVAEDEVVAMRAEFRGRTRFEEGRR